MSTCRRCPNNTERTASPEPGSRPRLPGNSLFFSIPISLSKTVRRGPGGSSMVQDPPEGMPDTSGVERSDPDDEILVLVVEDDLGYAVLVEELLADSGEPIKAV